MGDEVEVTVTLPRNVVDELRSIAASNGFSETAALVQSIKLNKFVDDRERASAKLLLEYPDGRMVQLRRPG